MQDSFQNFLNLRKVQTQIHHLPDDLAQLVYRQLYDDVVCQVKHIVFIYKCHRYLCLSNDALKQHLRSIDDVTVLMILHRGIPTYLFKFAIQQGYDTKQWFLRCFKIFITKLLDNGILNVIQYYHYLLNDIRANLVCITILLETYHHWPVINLVFFATNYHRMDVIQYLDEHHNKQGELFYDQFSTHCWTFKDILFASIRKGYLDILSYFVTKYPDLVFTKLYDVLERLGMNVWINPYVPYCLYDSIVYLFDVYQTKMATIFDFDLICQWIHYDHDIGVDTINAICARLPSSVLESMYEEWYHGYYDSTKVGFHSYSMPYVSRWLSAESRERIDQHVDQVYEDRFVDMD